MLTFMIQPAHAQEILPQKLLVLTISPQDVECQQTQNIIRRMMLYMNLSADYKDIYADLSTIDEYSAVILYVPQSIELTPLLTVTLRKSEKPLLIIGQGGIEQIAESSDYEHYKGSIMLRYETLGTTNNDLILLEEEMTLLCGETTSPMGSILIDSNTYPLVQTLGNITHLAYFHPEQQPMRILLSSLVQSWMWPYDNEPTTFSQYLVLDNVYPFMDPAKLMKITDMLEEEGVPYALSLMPIYANAQYPSMKKFCEYLCYVQSKGAGMILRAPLVDLGDLELDDLRSHIEISCSAYSSYGVYPLAIKVPEEYLLCADGLDLLAGIRTIFPFEAETTVAMDELTTNIAYAAGHQIIAPAGTSDAAFTTSYAQAIYLDSNEEAEVLRAQVKRLKNSKRVLKSLRQLEHKLYVGEQYIYNTTEGIYRNDQLADLNYVPFVYEADYDYDRGFLKYLTNQIVTSNQIIVIGVCISCAIFIVMIRLSRRSLKREIILGPRQKKRRKPHSDAGGE